MSDLHKLTIADARDKLRAKEITSVELAQSCLDAIDAADALCAYVHKTPDLAMINLNHPRQHHRVQNMPQKMGAHWVHMAQRFIRPTRAHRGH